MKHTGQCTKCRSYNVIKKEANSMHQQDQVILNSWGTKKIYLDNFICTDCGYSERFVQMNPKSEKLMKERLKKQGGGFDEYV